jgi:hypothetical protein
VPGLRDDQGHRPGDGLAYTLSEAADDGRCFLPVPNLITDAAKILEVPADMIRPCLDELATAEVLIGGPAADGRQLTAGPRHLGHADSLPARVTDGSFGAPVSILYEGMSGWPPGRAVVVPHSLAIPLRGDPATGALGIRCL